MPKAERFTPSPEIRDRLLVNVSEVNEFIRRLGDPNREPGPLGDRYHGHVALRTHAATDTEPEWLEVTHADPYIRVSDELLAILRSDGACGFPRKTPHAQLIPPDRHPGDFPWVVFHSHDHAQEQQCRPPGQCFTNWLLQIDARNQHLVYRIGAYRPWSNTWEAAWPD